MIESAPEQPPSNRHARGVSAKQKSANRAVQLEGALYDPGAEFRRANAARMWWLRTCFHVAAHWHGIPYQVAGRFSDNEPATAQTAKGPTASPYRTRAVQPTIPKAITYHLGMLINTHPQFWFSPATADAEDVRAARACDMVYRSICAANDVEKINKRHYNYLIPFGLTAEKIYWDDSRMALIQVEGKEGDPELESHEAPDDDEDLESGEEIESDEDADSDALSDNDEIPADDSLPADLQAEIAATAQEILDDRPVVKKKVWRRIGDVAIRHVDPFWMTFDPGARTKEEIQWIGERRIVSSKEAKDQFDVDADDKNHFGSTMDWLTPNQGQDMSMYRKGVEIVEFYHKPVRSRPRGTMMVTVNDLPIKFDTCPKCGRTMGDVEGVPQCTKHGAIEPIKSTMADLPYYEMTHGEIDLPYWLGTSLECVGTALPMSTPQHIVGQADSINRISSNIQDQIENQVRPMFLYPTDAPQDQAVNGKPFGIFKYYDKKPDWLNGVPLTQDAYQFWGQQVNSADAMSGSASAQEAAQNKGSKTATAVMQNTSENQLRSSIFSDALAKGIGQRHGRARMVIALAKAMYTPNRVSRVLGNKNRTTARVWSETNFDFADVHMVEGTDRPRDRFAELQVWQMMLSTAQTPEERARYEQKILGLNLVDNMDEGVDVKKQNDENMHLALGHDVPISMHDDHVAQAEVCREEYLERWEEWDSPQKHQPWMMHLALHSWAQHLELRAADPTTKRPAMFDPLTGLSSDAWVAWYRNQGAPLPSAPANLKPPMPMGDGSLIDMNAMPMPELAATNMPPAAPSAMMGANGL